MGVVLLQLFWIPVPFKDIGRWKFEKSPFLKLTLYIVKFNIICAIISKIGVKFYIYYLIESPLWIDNEVLARDKFLGIIFLPKNISVCPIDCCHQLCYKKWLYQKLASVNKTRLVSILFTRNKQIFWSPSQLIRSI